MNQRLCAVVLFSFMPVMIMCKDRHNKGRQTGKTPESGRNVEREREKERERERGEKRLLN